MDAFRDFFATLDSRFPFFLVTQRRSIMFKRKVICSADPGLIKHNTEEYGQSNTYPSEMNRGPLCLVYRVEIQRSLGVRRQ